MSDDTPPSLREALTDRGPPPWTQFPGAVYHVTGTGIEARIFVDASDDLASDRLLDDLTSARLAELTPTA